MHVNIYSVHMDETYWKDPHVFRPERHLNDQGKVVKSDHFMPFGVGMKLELHNRSIIMNK